MPGRVLVVDDDRSMCKLVEDVLRMRDIEACAFASPEDALRAFQADAFDAVLTDLNMPGMNGLELCRHIRAERPDVPVVVITAFGSMDSAIEAIRAGAYDFVTKPIEVDLLCLTVERALHRHALQEQVKRLSQALEQSQRFEELLGASEPMRGLYDRIARVADSDASVLITGESGTGKELVARALHARSRRSKGPFVALNCAGIPETLLESELFGHTRGAFTDARAERKGLFLQADGGALLLDEIGEFPIALQPKILRALEARSVRPIGSDREFPFDVRILAATNGDLEAAVEEGRFRSDFFYRVNVVQIELPPLRVRGSDILLLAQHFIEQFARVGGKRVNGLSKAAAGKLLAYPWPGNVRELRNAIERAVALTRYEELAVEDLPDRLRVFEPARGFADGVSSSEMLPLEEVERRHILRVLDAVGGNRQQAAGILGLDRKTLYRKLQRYDMGGAGD